MIDLIKKREKQAAYFESNTITQEEYLEIIDRAIAAEAKLAEIEKQESAYVLDYEYEEGHEDPDLGGDLIFHQLDGKTYPIGTEFYASPVQQFKQSCAECGAGSDDEGLCLYCVKCMFSAQQSPAVAVHVGCKAPNYYTAGVDGSAELTLDQAKDLVDDDPLIAIFGHYCEDEGGTIPENLSYAFCAAPSASPDGATHYAVHNGVRSWFRIPEETSWLDQAFDYEWWALRGWKEEYGKPRSESLYPIKSPEPSAPTPPSTEQCKHRNPITQHTGDGVEVFYCPDCGRNSTVLLEQPDTAPRTIGKCMWDGEQLHFESDGDFVDRHKINTLINLFDRTAPEQRITEQDAREIYESVIDYIEFYKGFSFDDWVGSDQGRALLSKLNEQSPSAKEK